MSEFSTIADIRDMEADEPIPAVKGILIKLFPWKSGKSKKGPWSFQNGELQIGRETIMVKFEKYGEEVSIKRFKGKMVIISDAIAYDEEYNDSGRAIKVTSDGSISLAGDGDKGDDADDRSSQQSSSKEKNPMGVFGGTVGMAQKEAIAIAKDLGYKVGTKEWRVAIWVLSSQIIRISLGLEQGKLASNDEPLPPVNGKPSAKKDKEPEPRKDNDDAEYAPVDDSSDVPF